LFYQQQNHGVEFFAFLHVDAYDRTVYKPGVSRPDRQAYLDNLMGQAIFTRDIGVSIDDQIILLTTCSSSSTNGRDVLVGRISNRTFKDSFTDGEALHGSKPISIDKLSGFISLAPLWFWLFLVLIVMGLIAFLLHLQRVPGIGRYGNKPGVNQLDSGLNAEQPCNVPGSEQPDKKLDADQPYNKSSTAQFGIELASEQNCVAIPSSESRQENNEPNN
jgi:hypothetical protein